MNISELAKAIVQDKEMAKLLIQVLQESEKPKRSSIVVKNHAKVTHEVKCVTCGHSFSKEITLKKRDDLVIHNDDGTTTIYTVENVDDGAVIRSTTNWCSNCIRHIWNLSKVELVNMIVELITKKPHVLECEKYGWRRDNADSDICLGCTFYDEDSNTCRTLTECKRIKVKQQTLFDFEQSSQMEDCEDLEIERFKRELDALCEPIEE